MSNATTEQMAALIRALEEAQAGYVPRNSEWYLGVMHGMQHAIDIARRAVTQAGRGDG